MSDEFQVPAVSSVVLTESTLHANLSAETEDRFPVLFDDEVRHFHEVRGGYDATTSQYVVYLGNTDGTVSGETRVPDSVEIHTAEAYYRFDEPEVSHIEHETPGHHTVEVVAESYQRGPYTFGQQLNSNLDKRHERTFFDE